MRKLKKNEILGGLLVVIGIAVLGNCLKFWKFNILFDGWWTLFIIIPSIVNIFKGNNVISQLLIFFVGMFLFFISQGVVTLGTLGNLLFPSGLIFLGIILLFNIKIEHMPKLKNKVKGTIENPNFVAIGCGYDSTVNYELKNSNCVSVFGNIDLDLTKAKIEADIIIEAVSIFGTISIKSPKGIDVKASGTAIFGSTSDNVKRNINKKAPTIYINYTCIFGDIEIN